METKLEHEKYSTEDCLVHTTTLHTCYCQAKFNCSMTGVRNVGNIGIGNEDKIIHWNTSWWPMLLLITHLSLPSTSSSSSEHHKNVLSKPDDILWGSATLDYMSNLISLSCHAVLCADTCSTMHANIIDAIITIGWRNIFSIFWIDRKRVNISILKKFSPSEPWDILGFH